MAESMDYLCGFDPFVNLLPALGVVAEHSRDLVKGNTGPGEQIGQFWHRARGAVCQPLGGHRCATWQGVEPLVVDRRLRLKIENKNRNLRAANKGEDSRG